MSLVTNGDNHKEEIMKRRATGSLVTLFLGGLSAYTAEAAITWSYCNDTSTMLWGSATWTGSPGFEASSIVSLNGNWWVNLGFGSTQKSWSAILVGQHLTAPHAGDQMPGDYIELGVLLTKGSGTGQAEGKTLHNPGLTIPVEDWEGSADSHPDYWRMWVGEGTGLEVTFEAMHQVPEPRAYCVVAGCALLGWITFRTANRRRNSR